MRFTRKELDSIADSLTQGGDGDGTTSQGTTQPWTTTTTRTMEVLNPLSLIFKPHRNAVSGNYDANVLIAALATRSKQVTWFDRRKDIRSLNLATSYGDDGRLLLGMIVNFWSPKLLGLWQSRHWVAICKIQGTWYNLDSDNAAPLAFADGEDAIYHYLSTVISNKGEIMLVTNDETSINRPPNNTSI
jgi:josephin